jgi:hypothetical protein
LIHILAFSLVVAGAALASLGVLRLTRAGFHLMPRGTAIAIVAAGTMVVAFGSLLPRFVHQRSRGEITLQREPSGATPAPVPNTDLRGVVRSATGQPVAGAKVVLYASTRPPVTVSSSADGGYVFRGLPIGGPYRVAVSYRGGVFAKAVLVPSEPLQTTVAATTTKPESMSVKAASLAVVGDARGVQAVYAATLENGGHDAYAGGVPLPVLPGAMGVDPRSGLDRTQLGVQNGTLYSSAPVLPGSSALTYTFVAPMPENGVDAATETTFPTARFDLLVAGRLRADAGKHATGTVRLGGRTYHRYTWRHLAAGDTISARIRASSALPLIRTAAIAAGGILAAAIVAFPLMRRRRSAPVASPSPVAANS